MIPLTNIRLISGRIGSLQYFDKPKFKHSKDNILCTKLTQRLHRKHSRHSTDSICMQFYCPTLFLRLVLYCVGCVSRFYESNAHVSQCVRMDRWHLLHSLLSCSTCCIHCSAVAPVAFPAQLWY